MIKAVDPNDSRAVRNVENTLACYELLINQKKPYEAAEKFLAPVYIQHNPLLGDDHKGLGDFFQKLTSEHKNARVVIHKIIASGDWLCAQGNFLNFLNDDPQDTGIAVVDMWQFTPDGKMLEHWDVLQVVGTSDNAAPWFGPNIRARNPNGLL